MIMQLFSRVQMVFWFLDHNQLDSYHTLQITIEQQGGVSLISQTNTHSTNVFKWTKHLLNVSEFKIWKLRCSLQPSIIPINTVKSTLDHQSGKTSC